MFMACSNQALKVQAKVASTMQPVIEQSHHEIIDAREAALMEAVNSEGTEAEVRTRVAETKERFETLLSAYALSRLSFNAWLEVMVRALSDSSVSIERIRSYGAEFFELYNELLRLADLLGVELSGGETNE
jgi:hypothetical protein